MAGSPMAGPPLRRLRYRIEYGAFWCIAAIAQALPLELCARWSAWCWRQLGRFNRRRRRALEQIAFAFPEMSEAERQAIHVQMWENLGRVFAETFHLKDFMEDEQRCEMTSMDELRKFIAENPRFVIVSLHSANWELAALGPLRAGLRIAGIYQAIKNPYVDAYVTRLREPLYPAALFDQVARHAAPLHQADARRRRRRHDVGSARGARRRGAVLRAPRTLDFVSRAAGGRP